MANRIRERARADEDVTMTVLIVDDHPSFRASARTLLEAEGYEVVGEGSAFQVELPMADRSLEVH